MDSEEQTAEYAEDTEKRESVRGLLFSSMSGFSPVDNEKNLEGKSLCQKKDKT